MSGESTYRRSAGTARGDARREDLLERVTEDVAKNGLADFSLRRAARAAGTTHKVLLYHFNGAEELLALVMRTLRERRIGNALRVPAPAGSLAEQINAIWPVLMNDESGLRVIDQAIGLAMYDPAKYAHLARDAADLYLVPLTAMCPANWSGARKRQVAEMVLATMRGFLMEWRTTSDDARIAAGLAALTRALEREEAAAD